MSKMSSMTHLDTSNTSYGQKMGWESNWQFDSRPLKVGNHPNFLVCRCCATYHWKSLHKGYNFSLDLISIEGLHVKLWAPKVTGAIVVRISGLPFGSLGTKWHLGAGLVARHKVYYKGEGADFPQVWVVVSLVSLSLPMACPGTKNAPTMHWPTCCLVLCKFVWVIDCLSLFLVPSQSSNTPLYPQSAVS
jgi:hypothetical protein